MTRRESLRNIIIASSGTILLAGCTEANAIEFLKDGKLLLNKNHLNYIRQISETLLPLKSLGDKIDGPTDFIMTMINDCHSQEDILKFTTGFDQYKTLMKQSKLKIKTEKADEVIAVVKGQLEASEPQKEMLFFINKIKSLAVRHLKSSKYYMEEYMEYKLIPERFDGCIPA